MALKVTNIRFASRVYEQLRLSAAAQGISVSQYVREAALIRLVLDDLDREDASRVAIEANLILELTREVRRLSATDDNAS